MTSPWPWLAVAGLGALHGLNPLSGWPVAAAWGARGRRPLNALLPMACGHLASVALVAGAVALGVAGGVGPSEALGIVGGRGMLQGLGVAVLAILGVAQLRRRGRPSPRVAGAGLALCSFVAATAHGAGLMLVPALAPLCLADTPAREITASGSFTLALAAIGVHLAAMLAAAGCTARLLRRILARSPGRRGRACPCVADARRGEAPIEEDNAGMPPDDIPISCDLHDGLETLATTRKSVIVRWRDAQGGPHEREAVITDIYSRVGAEYLVLSSGETLRLDQVSDVDGQGLRPSA